MVRVQRTALGMLMWSTTMLVAASGVAQSASSMGQACTVGAISSLSTIAATTDEIQHVAAAVPRLAAPNDDVQWCIDSSDPRCSPDPAGAPAAHLAHAGDAARVAFVPKIAAAPRSIVKWRDRAERCDALGVVSSIERPPQSR